MSQRTYSTGALLREQSHGAGSIFVPITLITTAIILLLNPLPEPAPPPPAVAVPPEMVETEPVRRPSLRPTLQIGGYTYRCNDCHALFPSPPETARTLTQHREIVLQHGINTRCFNCHHLTDRNVFADESGGKIPYGDPQHVCAKCHGPVFRDWVHGAHGRTEGHWDEASGAMRRRKCVECHDPHAPPFPSLAPAPAPRTLRMGETKRVHDESSENPLMIFRREGASSGGG